MTRKTAKEYVRVKVKQLKNDSIVNTFLDIELNLSQRKVQKDLMALELKKFNKQAFLSGPYAAVPADIMDMPDAIIDVKSATGVQASFTTAFSGVNNDMTLTWNEPGTGGNITDVVSMNDAQTSGIVITTSFSSGGIPSFLVSFAPGAVASTVIAAINAHNIMSLYFTAANASGNTGAGTITLGVSMAFTTAGGTGTGFYPADEISISDYNRVSDNALIAPSSVQPKYATVGDVDGTPLLQFLPKNVTVSLVHYKYLVADLTADTDSLTIPAGFEELVLLDMIRKAWDMLKDQANIEALKAEYETEKNKALASYQNELQAKVQEKTRLESADREN